MLTLSAVLEYLEAVAPLHTAAEWDNVGLLLGDPDRQVARIMTCLTVTPESAAEAVRERADLVVTHHPVMFRPVQKVTTATPEGRIVLSLAQARIAVYSPHTAFDNSRGGINDSLAARLELTEVGPLRPTGGAGAFKIVVFVPDTDLGKVSDAMFAEGAGQIGQYGECSFRLAGTGTFFGSETTNPAVGRKGRREEVNEWRLEAVCPASRVDAVISAIRRAHSYEEPAFDVYPLRPGRSELGEGRVGKLAHPVTVADLVQRFEQKVHSGTMRIVGDAGKIVRTVAIACGAGGSLLVDAIHARADVFLTGEMRFHDCIAAQAQGIAVLLPGHYVTERPGIEELAQRLQCQWPDLRVWACRDERDPVT
jgi:dinuclear metal center YbgI/SA1388 family protein